MLHPALARFFLVRLGRRRNLPRALEPRPALVLAGGVISRFQARWRRAGWRELVLLVAAATFFLALWCFVAVAGIVSTGNYTGLENRIMQSLRATDDPRQPIGPDWLPAAARDVTALGSAAVLIIVVALVIGWLALRRDHATALLILVATAGGSGLGHALKQIFDRARPEAVSHLVEVRSLSFPSGHSFNASVVYLTLGALLARTVVRRREKIYFIQGALFLALIVGLSRVYLGVHYPTDVLAGWSAGTAWALVCWYAALRLQRRGVLPAGAADEKRAAAD